MLLTCWADRKQIWQKSHNTCAVSDPQQWYKKTSEDPTSLLCVSVWVRMCVLYQASMLAHSGRCLCTVTCKQNLVPWCDSCLFEACTDKKQLLWCWYPVLHYISRAERCSLEQFPAALPVSCISVAPPAPQEGCSKESRSRFLRVEKSRGRNQRRKKKMEESGVQPKKRWRERVSIEKDKRERKVRGTGKEEDEGKAGLS